MNYDDSASLPQRIEAIVQALRQHAESRCSTCQRPLCGHVVIFSIVAGQSDAPRCLNCLAESEGREVEPFRDGLAMFVASKPCLSQGFALASLNEGFPVKSAPACLFTGTSSAAQPAPTAFEASPPVAAETVVADELFDAGDQGCGDLVLALRIRLKGMPAGSVLDLRATDPGAPTDIPAWCRLTGHGLIAAQHPHYFIQRKDDS